jgi:peptidyl-prolyl cis-trans isomerase B (cyclophilin B)
VRRWLGAGLATGALLVSACGSGSSAGKPVTQPKASTAPTPNKNGCLRPHALNPRPQVNAYPKPPPLTIAPTTYTARIVTNCGTIVVSMDGKSAPKTVNSFAFLAKKGFFDDSPCFRLTTQGIYVLQCGDPTGQGQYGPGYTLPDENLRGATYPAGTLAMANAGRPHTNDSEFFIVYSDSTKQLGPHYTPFGHITAGLDIVTRIAEAGSPGGDGPPVQPVVIESFTVTKG